MPQPPPPSPPYRRSMTQEHEERKLATALALVCVCLFVCVKTTQQLAAAEKPLILYGSAVLERDDSASIISILKGLNAHTKVR